MEAKDELLLTAQQKELWDKYSEMIDTDIDSLNYYAGKIILTHENYKKLCNELSTSKIEEQESRLKEIMLTDEEIQKFSQKYIVINETI